MTLGWWSWECDWCRATITTDDVGQAIQFVDAHADAHPDASDDTIEE